jgi:hypothetical protein
MALLSLPFVWLTMPSSHYDFGPAHAPRVARGGLPVRVSALCSALGGDRAQVGLRGDGARACLTVNAFLAL